MPRRTNRIWLRLTYRCCGMEWTDEWPQIFALECPDCGVLIEAIEVVEIPKRGPGASREQK
jgi:hypothetical protein